MPVGIEFRIDPAPMAKLAADLKTAGNKTLLIELRRGVKASGDAVKQAVQAAAPSGRIKSAIKIRASLSSRKPAVTVYADAKIAPNAAPINHGGRGGTFRHPVYPDPAKTRDQWNWADQAADPFFDQAVRGSIAKVDAAMLAVVDRIAKSAGYK